MTIDEMRAQLGLGSDYTDAQVAEAYVAWLGIYPLRGKSITPAGYLWSNAPDIVDAFSRGATIVPVNGRRFLAIPSDNVPRKPASRRGATKRMTPEQVEISFNQSLFFKRGKAGRVLAFVNRDRTRRGRGAAKGSSRNARPVLMFVLVPVVRLPKLLDLNGPAQRGAARFEAAFNEALPS